MLKQITLKDGIEVEIEIDPSQAHEISDDGVVDSSIDNLKTLLSKVIAPVSNTCDEINQGKKTIESIKVSIGVKVGIEGNFILAKSSAGANIQVEMLLNTKSGDSK